MYGHWLKQTRKLNKHYQKGVRSVPTPLWGSVTLSNYGVSLDSYCGLLLDTDGIYVCSQNASKTLTVPQNINLSSAGFTNILPLRIYDLNTLSVTGVNFSNLGTITDDSGKIKSKIDTVNFEYTTPSNNSYTFSRSCLIVYLDIADVDKTSGGNTRLKTYFNVKFSGRFRVPLSTPIDVTVNYNSLIGEYNGSSCGVSVSGTKRYYMDNGVCKFYPPSIGSKITLDTNFNITAGDTMAIYSPTLGRMSLIGVSTGVGNQVLDRRSSYGNIGTYNNGYFLGGSSGNYPYINRVYTNDFDTSILRSSLEYGTISGTGNLFNTTTVTGWT